MIAVPDHWHALVATEALNHKKDVYGEKPLAKTIAEQQAIVRAVERNKRIWQTGSWQRSVGNFVRVPFHCTRISCRSAAVKRGSSAMRVCGAAATPDRSSR